MVTGALPKGRLASAGIEYNPDGEGIIPPAKTGRNRYNYLSGRKTTRKGYLHAKAIGLFTQPV
jgi:hypothetical protein